MTRDVATAAVLAAALPGAALLSVRDAFAVPAVMCLFVAALAHLRLTSVERTGPSRAVTGLVLAGATVAATVWFLAPPPFCDDVYRYLLDGRAGASGLNPFAYAPGSPKVADLVAGLPAAPNNPELRTIYPPLAQAAFALGGLLGGTLRAWRAIALAAVVVGALVAGRLAPRAGALPMAVAVVSHPLVVVTAAGNGNVDVLGIPLVAAALLAVARARPNLGSALLGLAASVKLFPVLLPAGLAGRFGLRKAVLGCAVAATVLGVTYVPLAGLGPKAVGSLVRYADAWAFNAPVAPVVAGGIERTLEWGGVPDPVREPAVLRPGPEPSPAAWYDGRPSAQRWMSRRQLAGRLARAVAAVAVLLLAAWCAFRRRDFPASVTTIVAGAFLLSPVVHPWYLVWLLVPALASRSVVAATWCASATLAFWASAGVREGSEWGLPAGVVAVEYGAVVAAAIGAAVVASGARLRGVLTARDARE